MLSGKAGTGAHLKGTCPSPKLPGIIWRGEGDRGLIWPRHLGAEKRRAHDGYKQIAEWFVMTLLGVFRCYEVRPLAYKKHGA